MEVHSGLVGHADAPIRRSDDGGHDDLPGGVRPDLKRQRLPSQLRERLVGHAPVVAHLHPLATPAFDAHPPNVAGATHVRHDRQQPVPVTLRQEPDSSLDPARNLPVHDRHDAGVPVGDAHEGGL